MPDFKTFNLGEAVNQGQTAAMNNFRLGEAGRTVDARQGLTSALQAGTPEAMDQYSKQFPEESQKYQTNESALKEQKIKDLLLHVEVADKLMSGVNDEASYQRALMTKKKAGMDISQDPPNYDPNFIAQKKNEALGFKGQLEEELKRSEIQKNKAMANAYSNSTMDGDTLDFAAEQVLRGDQTPFANLGRGIQGPANIKALRQRVQQKAAERGMSGADLAATNAEYFGVKSGERTLGNRTANVEMAVNEAQNMIPLALKASEAVDRTKYPSLNKVLLAAQQGTGDENVVRLASATNSLINIYARAISPSGSPTVSDKDHAREILEKAWTKGQYAAGVDQMRLEMEAAKKSPGQVRKSFRDSVTGNEEPKQTSGGKTSGVKFLGFE